MEFTPLFVGGGWRSGTTVLQALVCTSPRTNDYLNECSYFMYLMDAYTRGVKMFDWHNRFYFRDKAHMMEVHGAILRGEVQRTWEWLNRPQILALRSPPMTGDFPELAQMIPETKFVVSVRDPRDVVASRVDVLRKEKGEVNVERAVRMQCENYSSQYKHLLEGNLGDRLCVIRYEDMVAGNLASLHAFGLTDIDPARLWESKIHDMRKVKGGAYLTPLYGSQLSDSSVGRYREVLSEPMQALVMELCGELAEEVRALAA